MTPRAPEYIQCEACEQEGMPVRRVGTPTTGDENAFVCVDARGCQRRIVVAKRERAAMRQRLDERTRLVEWANEHTTHGREE